MLAQGEKNASAQSALFVRASSVGNLFYGGLRRAVDPCGQAKVLLRARTEGESTLQKRTTSDGTSPLRWRRHRHRGSLSNLFSTFFPEAFLRTLGPGSCRPKAEVVTASSIPVVCETVRIKVISNPHVYCPALLIIFDALKFGSY